MAKKNNKVNNHSSKNNKKVKRGIDNLLFSDKVKIVIYLFIVFGMLFFIMYRNSKINETFSKLNDIKAGIIQIDKENNQLEVDIQSSLNLYNVEQVAKEQLGMQKLTNAQTIYISLPKKDYIESNVNEDQKTNDGFIKTIKNKINSIFNK